MAEGVIQAAKHLLSKHKALSSKRKKETKKDKSFTKPSHEDVLLFTFKLSQSSIMLGDCFIDSIYQIKSLLFIVFWAFLS
jgi:hypothetical protein